MVEVKYRRKAVRIGDTFRKTDATRWIWRVTHFLQPTSQYPHVRIARMDVAGDVRVFALAALLDHRLFSPVDRPGSRHWLPAENGGQD